MEGRRESAQVQQDVAQNIKVIHEQAVTEAIEVHRASTIQSVQSTSSPRAIQFFEKHYEDLMKQMRDGNRSSYEATLKDA